MMRVASCQLNSTDQRAENLATARTLLERSAELGADLAVLPEEVGYLGSDEATWPAPEPVDGELGTFFAQVAAGLRMWVLVGSFREVGPADGRAYNTSLLFDRAGKLVATYRKIHLYDVEIPGGVSSRESARHAPGDRPVVVDVEGVGVGLSICYDLRFPELYRALLDAGAQVLMVPAAFRTHTGKDHWEVLLRARAIENQCYVVAAGQIGQAGSINSYGRSMIVDPWGLVLTQAPDTTGVIIADIDSERLATIRAQLPSVANRRLTAGTSNPGGSGETATAS